MCARVFMVCVSVCSVNVWMCLWYVCECVGGVYLCTCSISTYVSWCVHVCVCVRVYVCMSMCAYVCVFVEYV